MILNLSCLNFPQGGRISLDMQLHNHCTTVSRIFKLQQNKTFTNGYLHKCIYLVNIGSNDYINNYLQPTYYTTSHIYTTVKYAKVLVRQYSKQLKVHVFLLFFCLCLFYSIVLFFYANNLLSHLKPPCYDIW